MKKEIFTDILPTWNYGTNKGRISWKESIGLKIKFIYGDIEGEIEILDFKNASLEVKYNNYICNIDVTSFLNCNIMKILQLRTREFKIDIGSIFKDEKRDIIITGRKYASRNDNTSNIWKWYKYKCNKCGWDEGQIEESYLLKSGGCSCCRGLTVVKGINDIATTHPDLIKYFVNIKDAYTNSSGSHKKIEVKCPHCGKLKNTKISLYSLCNAKSINCICNDKISYPTKLMYNLLKQVEIEFETEYSPKWCEYKLNNKVKHGRYDFYFELNDKKYIVEMDGGWHSKDNIMSGQTKEESVFIDNEKDRLANKQDIEVIRVDCKDSDLIYIKNNILKSNLKNLFNLDYTDWEEVELNSRKNICKSVCEYKKNNSNLSCLIISKEFKLSANTVTRYLKIGNDIGWCYYNAKEENLKALEIGRKSKGKRVEIYKDGVKLYEFKSCVELERKSEELFGMLISNQAVSACCLGKTKSHRGYTFKYIV